jgi:hypothetical protein
MYQGYSEPAVDLRSHAATYTMLLYNFVSSAYKAAVVLSGIESGRSLMNTTKSMGPKILPCGTPDVTEMPHHPLLLFENSLLSSQQTSYVVDP